MNMKIQRSIQLEELDRFFPNFIPYIPQHYYYNPHENEIYMRHIQLFGMKIYFEGLEIIYVKYILANISQKIYAKYILITQLFAKKKFHIYSTVWEGTYVKFQFVSLFM